MDGAGMMEFYSGLMFVVIGVLAILMNLLLTGILLRIHDRRRDLNLALVLAVVDMLGPIATTAYVLVSEKDASEMQYACKIKGPLDFLIIFGSMMLMAMIARTRCAFVVGSRIRTIEKVAFSVYVALYCSVVALIGYHDEYKVSPSGADCAPDVAFNFRSALLQFLLGLSMLMFSIIALACYSRILIFITHYQQNLFFIRSETISKMTRSANQRVVIRTLAVCSVYLLLSVPASILMMLEAIVPLPAPETLSLIISICVSLSAIANPCLIMFCHSIIFDQLFSRSVQVTN